MCRSAPCTWISVAVSLVTIRIAGWPALVEMRFAPPSGLPFTIVTVPTTLLAAALVLLAEAPDEGAALVPVEGAEGVEPPDEPQPASATTPAARRDNRTGVRRTRTSGSTAASGSAHCPRGFWEFPERISA